jgi:hypothetical protein
MPSLVIARMMSRAALKRFWALTVECQAILRGETAVFVCLQCDTFRP